MAAKNKVVIGYYETKTEAIETLNRLTGRTITERYNMTFSQVFNEWKEEHYKKVGATAISGYNRAYDVFEPLHDKMFRQLRTADFQAVIDSHSSKKHITLQKYKNLLTQMSKWAMREEIISKDFSVYVQIPAEEKREKEIFTEEEIAKLEADGSEAARIVLMLLGTGMRIGELFTLRLENCHERYVVGGEKTEAGKDRVIPVRPEAREHFDYFQKQAAGELLISGYSGKQDANGFRREYFKLLERLGISRKTPHSTRHTYASRARREGMQPEILQRILGHANYSTTAGTYVHAEIEQLLEAVEK